MTKTELQIRVELFRRELRSLEAIKVGCQSCEHYRYSTRPECARWDSQPPPDVVHQGCDEWSYDFIPF